MGDFSIPAFAMEAEETRWWFDNRDKLAEQFELAAAEGRLGRGAAEPGGSTPTTTIRLDVKDVARARVQAEQRGLKYQTYLKMLIHEALEREGQIAS